MAEDDNGWGDLFAKASGETVIVTEKRKIDEKPRRKKRKRSKQKDNETSRNQLLAGRLNVPNQDTPWPKWAHLEESLLKCDAWQGSQHSSCNKCGKSALHHTLRVTNNNESSNWPLQVFCCLRNLRCASFLLALGSVQLSQVADFVRSESNLLRRTVQSNIALLSAHGEDQVLESKFQAVMEAVHTILDNAKPCRNQEDDFEKAIQLIIATDDMYYRLYYLMISGVLTLRNGVSLPHPAEYYHVPFLAWVGMNEDLKDWEEFLEHACSRNNSGDSNRERVLRNEFAMRYGIDPFQTGDHPTKHTDVLTYLHHNRIMETAYLFHKSGWLSTTHAAVQTMQALDQKPTPGDTLSRHDTPAPPILSEWRDSCRDRLCNLYAYATVPSESVQRMKKVLESNDISGGIIEIGAGSGYLATLLKQQGIPVVAWDIHPPGSSVRGAALNEYHGHTPGFCNIEKGGLNDLRRHSSTTANAALLLCYPPPESPMAKDALEAYLDIGGRCLIHIGEFGGLTGSPAFESLLVRSCHSVDRFPCLSWGTDAAEVSVWIRADDEGKKQEQRLLLPCSICGKREASKRCRLVRHVVYCSKNCFEQHSSLLSVHLAMNMIPITASRLNFDDDRHFMSIQTGKRGGGKNERKK